jgi:hypothetical protein
MQISKTNGSPTVYSLRRAFGLPSRRASRFNACIGAALKKPPGVERMYQKPPAGEGGRLNKEVRDAFKAAVAKCK